MPPATRTQRLRKATQERREQEKEQLKEAILKAAGELFLEHGYEGFSLRQIAEEIGYSPGTIYLYFKDKDDVLFSIADEGFRLFGEQIEAAAASTDDPHDRLHAVADAYVCFGMEHPVYYQLMFIQRCDYLMDGEEVDKEPRIAILRIWQEAVAGAIDAGLLPPGDPESTADALWGLTHGVLALGIRMPIFDQERTTKAVARAQEMLKSLCPCAVKPLTQ